MPTQSRRRWFQVSLAEWLILTTLLSVAWWQGARWPVREVMPVNCITIEYLDESDDADAETFYMKFEPTPHEVAVRGAISSAAIVGVWLVGSVAVRAIWRRRPTHC